MLEFLTDNLGLLLVLVTAIYIILHFLVKNNVVGKGFGAILIGLGIDVILPPTPTIDLPIFLYFLEFNHVTLETITPEIYGNYVLTIIIIGVLAILFGLEVAGLSWRKFLKKNKVI